MTCGIFIAHGQTTIEKSIPVTAGQKVEMNFKRPELIKIEIWDKSEINIKAAVSINLGSNDDAFEIEVNEGNKLEINSVVRNYDHLPRRIMIKHQGEEYFFNTSDIHSPEVQKFLNETGREGYEYMKHGVIMDIILEIMVPSEIVLDIDAKYGMIEVAGFTNDMNIRSKYGGVDVSVNMQGNAKILAETKFGDVYSNLDIPFSGETGYRPGKWSRLTGTLNRAENIQLLRSEFGNIYIRKM